jgi:glyoxylase-like metal-dependent hydrolase (beta-lactamase superfamily II)
MKGATQLGPNLWFEHELFVDLGGREAQIRFLGRGNTAGDTVVYLPQEKLLVAGDLLDHPVPYFFGGFPVDLLATLGRLRELDVKRIVPGHGDVLEGTAYVAQVMELVAAVRTEVEKELNAGMTRDQVLDGAPKALDVKGFRQRFAGSDKENGEAFDASFEGLVKTMTDQVRLR